MYWFAILIIVVTIVVGTILTVVSTPWYQKKRREAFFANMFTDYNEKYDEGFDKWKHEKEKKDENNYKH